MRRGHRHRMIGSLRRWTVAIVVDEDGQILLVGELDLFLPEAVGQPQLNTPEVRKIGLRGHRRVAVAMPEWLERHDLPFTLEVDGVAVPMDSLAWQDVPLLHADGPRQFLDVGDDLAAGELVAGVEQPGGFLRGFGRPETFDDFIMAVRAQPLLNEHEP